MSLIKWTDSSFDSLERSMLSTIDDLDTRLTRRFGLSAEAYTPELDISEDKENYFIIAELPGLAEGDVKVSVADNLLTISGKKERRQEKLERNYHKVERSFGQFARSLSLPKNVKADAIKATFQDGLLELTLPKTVKDGRTTREIPITSVRHTK